MIAPFYRCSWNLAIYPAWRLVRGINRGWFEPSSIRAVRAFV